jgi:NitT/TauT family transport system permease protein
MGAPRLSGPIVFGALGVSLLLASWEILPATGVVDQSILPRLSTVARSTPSIIGEPGFRTAAGNSASWWCLGLSTGVAAGIPLGTAMGRIRAIHEAVGPMLTVLYSVPKIALVVPLVLLFGLNSFSMSALVFLGALMPVVIASYEGARRVSIHYLWSATALGVSRRALAWRVVLPAALPDVLSGIRVAVGFSLMTLMGAEFIVRPDGVGSYLFNNMDAGQVVEVWGICAMLAVTGFLADLLYVRIVSLAWPWIDDTA